MDTDHQMEAFITTPSATDLAAVLLMTGLSRARSLFEETRVHMRQAPSLPPHRTFV